MFNNILIMIYFNYKKDFNIKYFFKTLIICVYNIKVLIVRIYKALLYI